MEVKVQDSGKVVQLRPRRAMAVRWRCFLTVASDALRKAGGFVIGGLWVVVLVALHLARVVLAAFLVLLEPLVAMALLPLAFIGFLVTLVCGFLLEMPGYPKWPMLGMSVGALVLYWLFMALIVFVGQGVAAVSIDLALLERINEVRRFEARTLEIAKRLFIHGETPKRLSVEYGVNIQRVYAIRREVLAAANDVALPTGWAEATLRGPKELIERLRQLHREEMARLEEEGGDR